MSKSSPAPAAPATAGNIRDAFVVETYKDKQSGEEKSKYHQVGNVVAHKKGEGQTLYLIPGISVSGEIVIFPRKARPADGSPEQ